MSLDFRFYLSLIVRRFPIMALLFLACASSGVLFALRMPETFATSARLLVEEPQIPDSMIASTISNDAVQQLDIIQQQLLTRANLIDIANKANVYTDLRSVSPDVIVQRMKADTTIRRSDGRNQATLMTISFRGRSGAVVANVVNEYVTLVLEANANFRIGRAENTLVFFEQEVERLGEELDEQSARISSFKSLNAEALPENQTYRLGRQSLLQERLSLLERDLRQAMSQQGDLQTIFDTTGRISAEQQQQQQRRTVEEQQLLVARADLELALSTYTASNPRVIRLQSVVDRLESIVSTQQLANVPVGENDEDEPAMSPEQVIFQATMIDIENRIETINADIEVAQAELEGVQQAIVATSENGIQLNALERDYEAMQGRYDAAVSNLNEARISERIETTAQGQRITVIENANVPSAPSGPSRFRIIALASGVGLALAGGFFILLEFLNRTIRRPVELIGRFNVTPLATIPYMESRRRRTVRRFSLVLMSLIVLIGVPAGLWYIDTNYLPLDLVAQRVLSRFGLV